MTKLTSTLAAVSLVGLAGCVTNPSQPDQTAQPAAGGPPRPIATVPSATTAPATAAAPVKPASIVWNDTACNKSTLAAGAGTAGSALMGADNSCVKLVVSGTKAPGKTPAVGPAPDAKIYTARFNLPACTLTSSSALQSAAQLGTRVVSNIGGVLGRMAGQAANQVPGVGAAAGNAAGAATAKGRAAATAPVTEAATVCNAQIEATTRGEFATGVKALVNDWRSQNAGYNPVIVTTTEFTGRADAGIKAAVRAALVPGVR